MRRGDVVTVALGGDYGKPRPAVIVQTDALPEAHASVILCPMTSDVSVDADFRLIVEPTPTNGLRIRSQVMADKPVATRRERLCPRIGRLAPSDTIKLNAALAFVLGLAD